MNHVENFPKVSVIVPMYNGESFIAGCLEHLLKQNYPAEKLEIIVVDNQSTDRSYEIARKYQDCNVKMFCCSTRGPSAARNMGIREATGYILLFTDVDCRVDPNWVLHHVLAHLYFEMTDPAIQVVGGGIAGQNGSLWAICDDICSWALFHPALPSRMIAKHHPTANLSVTRRLVEALGGFDEGLRTGEDYAFCAKVRQNGYRIFFEPRAKVTHINRTSFRQVMRHHLDWSAYSFLLLPGRHQILLKNIFFRLLVFGYTFIKNIMVAEWYSLRAGRLIALPLLPAVMLNRFIFSYGFMKSVKMAYAAYNERKSGKPKEFAVESNGVN